MSEDTRPTGDIAGLVAVAPASQGRAEISAAPPPPIPVTLMDALYRLEVAARAVIRHDLDEAARQGALEAAHGIMRTHPALVDREFVTQAGEVADLLSRKVPLSSWEELRLSDLTQSMRRQLERGADVAPRAPCEMAPQEPGEEPPTVAILAADRGVASALRAALASSPARVVQVEGIGHLRDVLDEDAPEVILLDVDPPWEAALGNCAEASALVGSRRIPVVAVARVEDPALAERILQSGAADLLRKPLLAGEVRARVGLLLRLARAEANDGSRFPGPAVAGARPASALLDPLLNLAHRQGQSLAMSLLGLRGEGLAWPPGIRLAAMRVVGQRLLPSFRSYDVVFPEAPDVIGLAMYGTRCVDAAHRLSSLLEEVCREPVTLSDGRAITLCLCAGVAQYPHDGQDVASVAHAAHAALEAARRVAPDRAPVVMAGGPERGADGTQTTDVVLVDDDESLASLLRHALDVQGLSSRWLRDGEAAYEMLGGIAPRLKARVVLLEVDLAGLSGLALLRRLAQDGVLVETHVITLTARTDEAEQLALLELGAHDHVAKPASVPLLLQRVRHALRR